MRKIVLISILVLLFLIGGAVIGLAQTVAPNPTSSTIATVGGTATVQIRLDNAPNGVRAYNIGVQLTPATCAANITGVDYTGVPSGVFGITTNADISPDRKSVPVAGFAIAPLGPQTNVVLGRVTFTATGAGTSPCTIQLTINTLQNDAGTPFGTAANGTLNVPSGPPGGPVVSAGSATINTIGGTATVQITLNQAPAGVMDFVVLVALSPTGCANITAVTIDPGYLNVDNRIAAGNKSATMAGIDFVDSDSLTFGTVTFTALADGVCSINLTINRLNDDTRAAIAATASPGTLTVSTDPTPPVFSNQTPAAGATVTTATPVISVNISDPESGVNATTISMTVTGCPAPFTPTSPGASWAPPTFSVNLAAAGCTLAAGPVTVNVTANNNAGLTGSTSWSFSVVLIKPGDVNNDGQVNYNDARLVTYYIYRLVTLTPAQLQAANVAAPCGPPHDGRTINYLDSRAIALAAAGRLAEFTCYPGVPIDPLTALAAVPLAVTEVAVYPNPVSLSGSREVRFVVEGQGIEAIKVEIFDLAGRRIFDSGFTSGRELSWNLLGRDGRRVANGVYLYVVTVRGYNGQVLRSEVKKLVVLR